MLKRLWNRWIEFTRKRAEMLAWKDMMLFGTGFHIRRWWGYEHLSPFSVTTTVNTQPPSGERFFGMEMKSDVKIPCGFVLENEVPWFNLDDSAYDKFVMGKW